MVRNFFGMLFIIIGVVLVYIGIRIFNSFNGNIASNLFIPAVIITCFLTGWITSRNWVGAVIGVICGVAFAIFVENGFSTDKVTNAIYFGFLDGLFGFISGGLGSLVPYPPRVRLPSASGFLWTLLFGGISGGLASLFFSVGYSSSGDVSIFPLLILYNPRILVIVCLIIGSAGFITGRLARTRILTGGIAGIIIVAEQVYITIFSRHGNYLYEKLYALPFLDLGIVIVAATLVGFIGGWLGMLGQE